MLELWLWLGGEWQLVKTYKSQAERIKDTNIRLLNVPHEEWTVVRAGSQKAEHMRANIRVKNAPYT